jgi:hypothetical protein
MMSEAASTATGNRKAALKALRSHIIVKMCSRNDVNLEGLLGISQARSV